MDESQKKNLVCRVGVRRYAAWDQASQMTSPTSSARRSGHEKGPRWDVIRTDLKNFLTRLPGLFRGDYTAVMLVFANVYPVIDMLFRGDPIGSILVIYWMQMMIIGFWTIPKLIAIMIGFDEIGMKQIIIGGSFFTSNNVAAIGGLLD